MLFFRLRGWKTNHDEELCKPSCWVFALCVVKHLVGSICYQFLRKLSLFVDQLDGPHKFWLKRCYFLMFWHYCQLGTFRCFWMKRFWQTNEQKLHFPTLFNKNNQTIDGQVLKLGYQFRSILGISKYLSKRSAKVSDLISLFVSGA